MIKRQLHRTGLPLAAVLLASIFTLAAQAQEPDAGTAPAKTPPAPPPNVKPPPPPPDIKPPPPPPGMTDEATDEEMARHKDEALRVMGWSMGSQLGLNPEFTGKELALIFQGMKDFARGGERPDNFRLLFRVAKTIYKQKVDAYKAEREKEAREEREKFFAELDQNPDVQKTDSGLRYEIIREGEGPKPGPADKVKVHYHGTLTDGTVFDSSVDRGQPQDFVLNKVVKGMTEGLQLIGEGGKIKLYIPPGLGYGSRGKRPIPPGAILIFDVELIENLTRKEAESRETESPPDDPESRE